MDIEQMTILEFLTRFFAPIVKDAIKANIMPPSPPQVSDPLTDRFIDTKEVSKILGISSVSVWQYEKDKKLQSCRIGNLKRFKLSEVLTCPTAINRTKK